MVQTFAAVFDATARIASPPQRWSEMPTTIHLKSCMCCAISYINCWNRSLHETFRTFKHLVFVLHSRVCRSLCCVSFFTLSSFLFVLYFKAISFGVCRKNNIKETKNYSYLSKLPIYFRSNFKQLKIILKSCANEYVFASTEILFKYLVYVLSVLTIIERKRNKRENDFNQFQCWIGWPNSQLKQVSKKHFFTFPTSQFFFLMF